VKQVPKVTTVIDEEAEERECEPSPEINAGGSEKDGAIRMTTVTDKAVKSDDAQILEHLWNDRVFENPSLSRLNGRTTEAKKSLLDSIRKGGLKYWKDKVERDFLTWFHGAEHRYDERQDLFQAGMKACVYARRCSWWEWLGGSMILFWRWPLNYMKEAKKDGVKPYFDEPPPSTMDHQPAYADAETQAKVRAKVDAVRKKGYITNAAPHEIRSLMYMFDVPKGLCDVRMVYDGSKSGLNNSLFAPWFALPMVDAMVRSLMPGYWCADNDYGKQFLNFNLHEEIQAYCGVDLSQLFPEDVDPITGILYGKWTRAAMGLRPSPYGAVKGSLRAKRIILGNRFQSTNPFQWETIRKNQPGDSDYVADWPWISKLRGDGRVASELLQKKSKYLLFILL
jgi:hypothetical protein